MIGVLVFGLLFAYVALFSYLVKILPSRNQKIAAIVLGLAIPLWELPFSYVSYRTQCQAHGGLQVFGDSPRTESILFEPGIGYQPKYVAETYGFKKIEYRSSSQVVVYTVTKQGIERSTEANPTSRFKISYVGNERAGLNVTRRNWILSHTDTGKILARHSGFVWQSLWWQPSLVTDARGTLDQCHMNDLAELLRFASGAPTERQSTAFNLSNRHSSSNTLRNLRPLIRLKRALASTL